MLRLLLRRGEVLEFDRLNYRHLPWMCLLDRCFRWNRRLLNLWTQLCRVGVGLCQLSHRFIYLRVRPLLKVRKADLIIVTLGWSAHTDCSFDLFGTFTLFELGVFGHNRQLLISLTNSWRLWRNCSKIISWSCLFFVWIVHLLRYAGCRNVGQAAVFDVYTQIKLLVVFKDNLFINIFFFNSLYRLRELSLRWRPIISPSSRRVSTRCPHLLRWRALVAIINIPNVLGKNLYNSVVKERGHRHRIWHFWLSTTLLGLLFDHDVSNIGVKHLDVATVHWLDRDQGLLLNTVCHLCGLGSLTHWLW